MRQELEQSDKRAIGFVTLRDCVIEAGTSPTVREGSFSTSLITEPSLTVGLVPRKL